MTPPRPTDAGPAHPTTLFGRLLDAGADAFLLREADGDAHAMPLGRWLAPATAVDERVLDRARGPVLDVGCGPGRHVHALSRRGIPAVGVELSPTAVRHARQGGARVVEGSIFEVAPDPGAWRTALLLDGNIGIGGRPEVLLDRLVHLLADDGAVLVELEADAPTPVRGAPAGGPARLDRTRVRIESAGSTSTWFPWARVGADGIAAPAEAAGLRIAERWADGGRAFCSLVRR